MPPALPPRRAAALLLTIVSVLALTVPAAASTDQFTLSGRGNGHGIGLSQYGAQGQALEGRKAGDIISTYYQGAGTTARTVDFDPRIGVAHDADRIRIVVRNGTAQVTMGGTTQTAAKDSVWTMTPLAGGSCKTDTSAGSGTTDGPCPSFDPNNGARIQVGKPAPDGKWHFQFQYGRDSVVEVIGDKMANNTWRLDVVVELPMEQYLYGLAEMPYSWEPAALQAQAIAGRSYALHRLISVGPNPDRGCSCHLYDSQQDQVFAGANREIHPDTKDWWPRWKKAVDDTKSVVVHAPDQIGTQKGVVQAFYSSSSNGRTESKHELWGGEPFPYLMSVKDPWAYLDAVKNPHRWWSAAVGEASIASRAGLDEVLRVDIVSRSTSGAVTTVDIVGRKNGKQQVVRQTGNWLRSNLGLRSTTIDTVFMPPFTDDDGNIHEADIVWLADQKITLGCNPPDNTRFCPGNPVTRAEMASFLTRALDLKPQASSFEDVPSSNVHSDDIGALAAAGITKGCNPPDNTRFCPGDPVTRDQMASFLTRALEGLTPQSTDFEDVPSSNVHAEDIGAIAADGITKGCNPPKNTRFCPGDPVTRAQMASFLKRALG